MLQALPLPARLLTLIFGGLLLASCSSRRPVDFASQRPLFEVEKYYAGHTRSTGLIQTGKGKPVKRVKTETWGRLDHGELHMTQDVTLDDASPTRRQWLIRRLDPHHYEGTCDHMIGKARGEAWGNTLKLDYKLALRPGNPLFNVRMVHWMQLQPDGHTMLNTVTVTKAGLVVGRITEVFERKPVTE